MPATPDTEMAPAHHPSPLRLVLLALIAVLLGGCVDMDTVVKVRGDGSGVITERVLIDTRLLAPLRALGEGFGGKQGEAFSLFDEAQLAARAEAMGEGVWLMDVDQRRDSDAEGYIARYGFSDVSRVRINQNPGELTPGNARGLAGEEYITFDFTPGTTAELTVHMPGRAKEPGKAPPGSGTRPELPAPGTPGRAGLEALFKGLRVAVAVEVQGLILETDATHHSGERVTLMEIDFEKLLSAPEYLDKLTEERPRSLEEAKRLLKDFPGIKMELAPEVTIRFRDYGLRAI